MMFDIVEFDFRSRGGHKNGPLYFELVAAVSYTLSMVASTCSNNSPFALLLSQVSKGSGSTSNFETSYSL